MTVRGDCGSGNNGIGFGLYDGTNTLVPNSSCLVEYASSGGNQGVGSTTIVVTTTGAETFTVRIWGLAASGTPKVYSDSSGYSKVVYEKLNQSIVLDVYPNGPAFSAYQSATGTALTSSGPVQLTFDTEDFDTNSNFNLATDRFTPTVEGYYQVTVSTMIPSTSIYVSSIINKNGVKVCDGQAGSGGGVFYGQSIASKLIYMNGTTDYLEAAAIATSSITSYPNANGVGTYFQASLVRGV